VFIFWVAVVAWVRTHDQTLRIKFLLCTLCHSYFQKETEDEELKSTLREQHILVHGFEATEALIQEQYENILTQRQQRKEEMVIIYFIVTILVEDSLEFTLYIHIHTVFRSYYVYVMQEWTWKMLFEKPVPQHAVENPVSEGSPCAEEVLSLHPSQTSTESNAVAVLTQASPLFLGAPKVLRRESSPTSTVEEQFANQGIKL
jgi:predicted nucleic acid-binding Zn ribbon protein